MVVWNLDSKTRQEFNLGSTTNETCDLGQKFFVPQFLHLSNGADGYINLIMLLLRLNELICI